MAIDELAWPDVENGVRGLAQWRSCSDWGPGIGLGLSSNTTLETT
jgi:hypothetical protein